MECWLRPNARAIVMGAIFPAAVACGGALLALLARGEFLWWWRAAGCLTSLSGLYVTISLIALARLPRIGYQDAHLLVYLTGPQPERVPIELVECFFRGQGPGFVHSSDDEYDDELPQANNVLVRLAERDENWRERETKRALGHWCDGYITIRGVWCEPIDGDLLQILNAKLAAAHRDERDRRAGRGGRNETSREEAAAE
ncbi:MAG: hypothetical protein QGG36_10165 [Pirellulaceae bacterium]|nr:hypothetical protein [Pirellulaceae bacterium]MDP7016155.1 hypothetical protein [Pirellulaceae bacterium]